MIGCIEKWLETLETTVDILDELCMFEMDGAGPDDQRK